MFKRIIQEQVLLNVSEYTTKDLCFWGIAFYIQLLLSKFIIQQTFALILDCYILIQSTYLYLPKVFKDYGSVASFLSYKIADENPV